MQNQTSRVLFGEWVKKRRKSLDMTQDELAQRAGCSVFALRKIESGERRPSRQLAELLGKALDIPNNEREAFVRTARESLSSEQLEHSHPLPDQNQNLYPLSLSPSVPIPATLLVGRENDLSAIKLRLQDPQCRLITLVGPGGIGKTRMAIEVAIDLAKENDLEAVFVPLAPINAGAGIIPAIADTLGYKIQGSDKPKRQLFQYLHAKKIYLVLDNFEHLMDGVGLLDELLQFAPGVKILCTSRERLNIQGEWVYNVKGLDTPEAVVLFANCARRVNIDFEITDENRSTITEICCLVEGMPLAIELAATWMRVLSLQEIVEEIQKSLDFLSTDMRDLPARHRSMRAVFGHSWNLLKEEEQQILSRLSVFRGGFSRKAAEEVAGASLSLLSQLVDKSLVRRESMGRYDLHELIRQYANEMLDVDREKRKSIQDCHSKYYLNLLQRTGITTENQELQEGNLHPAKDIENLRVSMQWAHTQGYIDLLTAKEYISLLLCWGAALELAGHWQEAEREYLAALERSEQREEEIMVARCQWALGKLYRLQMKYDSALECLERSRVKLKDINEPGGLCQTLTEIGFIYSKIGNFAIAKTYLERSLAIARETGDKSRTAWSIYHLGLLAWYQRDYKVSNEFNEESFRLFKQLNDNLGMAWTLNDLGILAQLHRDYKLARTYCEKSLELRREIGEKEGTALVLTNLGVVSFYLHDYTAAKKSLEEGFMLSRELGLRVIMAKSLNWTGYISHIQNDLETAQECYNNSFILYRLMDDKRGMGVTLTNLGNLALDKDQDKEAFEFYRESLAYSSEVKDDSNIGCSLIGLSGLASKSDNFQHAVMLASAADKLRMGTDLDGDVVESRIFEHVLNASRTGMGEKRFHAAWKEGQDLPLEHVIKLATTVSPVLQRVSGKAQNKPQD